jgi:hypothetical protein
MEKQKAGIYLLPRPRLHTTAEQGEATLGCLLFGCAYHTSYAERGGKVGLAKGGRSRHYGIVLSLLSTLQAHEH